MRHINLAAAILLAGLPLPSGVPEPESETDRLKRLAELDRIEAEKTERERMAEIARRLCTHFGHEDAIIPHVSRTCHRCGRFERIAPPKMSDRCPDRGEHDVRFGPEADMVHCVACGASGPAPERAESRQARRAKSRNIDPRGGGGEG